jgi:PAS domain S-box-containing protein
MRIANGTLKQANQISMRTKWSELKRIIGEVRLTRAKYISLISEDGTILSANARMIRSLHLSNSKEKNLNLFDLLHPVNKNHFIDCLSESDKIGTVSCVEAYLKNGLYHPMKWHITPVPAEGSSRQYLCQGYKLLDENRTREFYRLGEYNYQLIFDSLDAGILFQDAKGEIIAANQKTAEILNISLEELYNLNKIAVQWNKCWDIRNEQDLPVLFEKTSFIKALQTRKRHSEVLVIRLQNGEQRWLHLSSQPLFRDHSSIPFAVVSGITDLTMEKKLIHELKERKAVLRSFMKQTPNLAWVVDEKASLLFASRNFYDFFRIEEDTAATKSLVELVPPSIAEALLEKHLRVLETGISQDLIQTIKWADGSDYVFHIDIFPIEGISGKKVLGGHAVNLTDKSKAEKKLQETNDRLLLLSRATTDAIWEWDMQTGQIFRNDALMDLIGYHTDIPKGLSWWLRRIHPEDRNRVGDAVKQSTEEGRHSWEGEYRFKCADGEYKHMRDKGFIVYENGLPVKMIGSIQDVSNIKELEKMLIEERLKRHKDVSELVIQAQEKERTQIGHELHDNVNQILSSAKLFFEMLQPEIGDQLVYQSKGLEYISLAIEEIRKLSKELVAPRLKENNLISCISQLLEDTRMASTVDIHFIHDLSADLLTEGKKVTLFRILQEQLKNILKHSGATRVDVTLESNDQKMWMRVKDNGVGFDANQTFRGIGLSNIFERVRFYDGTADLKTAAGEGCLLIVTMPLL